MHLLQLIYKKRDHHLKIAAGTGTSIKYSNPLQPSSWHLWAIPLPPFFNTKYVLFEACTLPALRHTPPEIPAHTQPLSSTFTFKNKCDPVSSSIAEFGISVRVPSQLVAVLAFWLSFFIGYDVGLSIMKIVTHCCLRMQAVPEHDAGHDAGEGYDGDDDDLCSLEEQQSQACY